MSTGSDPAGLNFKVVCAWCGAFIRLRERKDSQGMCVDSFRRLLHERTRGQARAAPPDKASDR